MTDRTSDAMTGGALIERWPEGDDLPAVGRRVVVFDAGLDFTQHRVDAVSGRSVTIGPAIPWVAVDEYDETSP